MSSPESSRVASMLVSMIFLEVLGSGLPRASCQCNGYTSFVGKQLLVSWGVAVFVFKVGVMASTVGTPNFKVVLPLVVDGVGVCLGLVG